MARLYFVTALPLTSLLALCSVILSAVGSTQPTLFELRAIGEGCEIPLGACWQGIALLTTTIHEAETLMTDRGYVRTTDYHQGFLQYRVYTPPVVERRCSVQLYYHFASEVVNQVDLYACDGFHLGDIAAFFGEPTFFYMDWFGQGAFIYLDERLAVYFEHGLMPYTPASRISLTTELSGVNSFEWYGYAPYWRYCQIHWDNYGC
jgi:hypothetical protein